MQAAMTWLLSKHASRLGIIEYSLGIGGSSVFRSIWKPTLVFQSQSFENKPSNRSVVYMDHYVWTKIKKNVYVLY